MYVGAVAGSQSNILEKELLGLKINIERDSDHPGSALNLQIVVVTLVSQKSYVNNALVNKWPRRGRLEKENEKP